MTRRGRLIPFTGWFCLGCGHRTDRGFPPLSCCSDPLPVRALIEQPRITDDERAQITEARELIATAESTTDSAPVLAAAPTLEDATP